MKHVLKFLLELIAALTAIAIIVVGLLAWRVAAHPMNATKFTPYIEQALTALVPNTSVKVAETNIVWNNERASLSFLAKDVHLKNRAGDDVAIVPSAHFEVSVTGLLRGRFIPSIVQIESPQFWMTRDSKGLLTFGLHDDSDQTEPEPDAKNLDTSALAATFSGLAKELTHKKLSHELRMVHATLSVHDEVTDQNWSLNVPQFEVHHEGRTLAGEAQIALVQKNTQANLNTHFVYDRAAHTHTVTVNFAQINPAFLAGNHPALAKLAVADLPVDGELSFLFDESFTLLQAAANLKTGTGQVTLPEIWDAPQKIQAASLTALYDRPNNSFKIPNISVDFGGPKLQIEAIGTPPKPEDAEKYDLAFTVRLALANLAMAEFGNIWPKTIIPNVRLWIMANMTKGHFPAGDVTLNGKLAWKDLENTLLESGSGKIAAQGGRVTYMEGMPAVDGVNAEASFDLDHMDVKILTGNVGSIKVQPFTIGLLDFQKNIQRIEIPLQLTGPALEVLRLMDSPPLSYAKAIGIKPEDCGGKVEGTLLLKFPLLLDLALDQVDLQADAKLSGFTARGLIPSIDISHGDMDLKVTKEGFSLKGPAALNTVPFQVAWLGNFDAEQRKLPRYAATITGSIKEDQWKLLGLTILDGRMEGWSQAVVKFTQPNRDLAQLSGEVNIKQASLAIPELNWIKQAGLPAVVPFAVDIPKGKNVQIRNIELQTPQQQPFPQGQGQGQGQGQNPISAKVKGKITLDEATLAPLSVEMKPLILGRTNANLSYTQTLAPKKSEHYAIEGESLDISTLSKEDAKKEAEAAKDPTQAKPESEEPNKEFSLKLTRLYNGEDNILYNVTGFCARDAQGWSRMSLRALTDDKPAGKNKFEANLGTYDGRNVLNITADDFGGAMKALGYTDTIRDGSLEIRGTSLPNDPRKIQGKIKVTGFGVRDLPVLARLLNAASPFGFADLISGETSFDYLRGQFFWKNDSIELQKVRLLGSTYGLNVNGKIDQKTGQANLHGTLVPFSFLNSIINAIPMLGNVITGGDGQGVIAASYTLKGPLTDPDISVNPVSLLTPGFLRNLFFSED